MRTGAHFAFLLLVIEFLDEFIYGAREAAWPLIRTDLALNYAQIGLLLGLPGIVSALVEPLLGVLGDIWRRRLLILGGGILFALSLLLTGMARSYGWLMISFVLFNPASGAFVSLSQASLMDAASERREQAMARWTFAGSLGVVLGPAALALFLVLGLGWRGIFIATAAATLLALPVVQGASFTPPGAGRPRSTAAGLRGVVRDIAALLHERKILRWLILLQFSDLMLDVLLGYLALYFVDVVGVSSARASTAVAVWTTVGLLGDFLLIPLLERVPGLRYLRVSAAAELVLFVAFLSAAGFGVKLALVGLLGLLNAGWYAILKARLYAAMPDRSGMAMAIYNLFGLVGAVMPWGLGLVAQHLGLRAAMWCLAAGPVALLLGLPRTAAGEARRGP